MSACCICRLHYIGWPHWRNHWQLHLNAMVCSVASHHHCLSSSTRLTNSHQLATPQASEMFLTWIVSLDLINSLVLKCLNVSEVYFFIIVSAASFLGPVNWWCPSWLELVGGWRGEGFTDGPRGSSRSCWERLSAAQCQLAAHGLQRCHRSHRQQ